MRALSLVLAALVCACTSNEARESELFITPQSFIVDGTAHPTSDAAALVIQSKAPAVLAIASCSGMETKRVTDAMASLQGKHSARVLMSVVGPGVRGCPEFKP
jgi:hypothetical protein